MICNKHSTSENVMNKYLSFDIETAIIVNIEKGKNLLDYRPLGICCASFYGVDFKKPVITFGGHDSRYPEPRMTKDEVNARIVKRLDQYIRKGYTIVTWNGFNFDFNILAEESGQVDLCKRMAINHVDMLFHFFCAKGFLKSLSRAAEEMDIGSKYKNIHGSKIPRMWKKRKYHEVFKYAANDSRLTLKLAVKSEELKKFIYNADYDDFCTLKLDNGWLNVYDAFHLPLPDVSWMKWTPKKKSRYDFLWFSLSDFYRLSPCSQKPTCQG